MLFFYDHPLAIFAQFLFYNEDRTILHLEYKEIRGTDNEQFSSHSARKLSSHLLFHLNGIHSKILQIVDRCQILDYQRVLFLGL